jgi:hypothetical protein
MYIALKNSSTTPTSSGAAYVQTIAFLTVWRDTPNRLAAALI